MSEGRAIKKSPIRPHQSQEESSTENKTSLGQYIDSSESPYSYHTINMSANLLLRAPFCTFTGSMGLFSWLFESIELN